MRVRPAARGIVAAVLALTLAQPLFGQPGDAQPAPIPGARAAAPIDLTGYWVSIISEDWRFRMVTPPRGDYAGIPIKQEAKRLADAWDPMRDEAAGDACRSYGAAAIMRVPGRLHISWQDDSTLKVETDAGTQTRLLHFGAGKPKPGLPTWQGDSVAEWDIPGGGGRVAGAGGAAPKFGTLKVVTTNMRAGYLRKNGVPYSANAVMTEFWDLHKEKSGDEWVVITTFIDDPAYLAEQYVTSPNFKRERDASKCDPSPCSARW